MLRFAQKKAGRYPWGWNGKKFHVILDTKATTSPTHPPTSKMEKKQYYERSWLDGCFDFMHFGHANAILQAKITSRKVRYSKYEYANIKDEPEASNVDIGCEFFAPDTLSAFRDRHPVCPLPRKGIWIGLHSDFEIMQHKGSLPVMTLHERSYHVSFIRWVSDKGVVQNVPYVTDLDAGVNDSYCEFVLHGDDLVCDASGKDCYYNVRQENRFFVVKRTEGVSTTEIIQRILTDSYKKRDNTEDFKSFLQSKEDRALCKKLCRFEDGISPHCWVFKHDLSEILVEGGWNMGKEQNIVFYSTERLFDLLNGGDIEILESIKKRHVTCKLLVGLPVGDASCVNNFRERLFSLASCSLVDGIVLDPAATAESQFPFAHVFTDDSQLDLPTSKFHYLTAEVIKNRIRQQRAVYESRNKRKLDG